MKHAEPVSRSMRIVVCGAGVIGAAVAYELTLRGARPLIVERARPAAAASGRAGGFLALDWNDSSPLGPLARASFATHRELAATLGDTGYRTMETVMTGGIEGGHVAPYRDEPNPEWLDGQVAVHSVIGTHETTAQVDPAKFTEALVGAARAAGATLLTGIVDGLTRSGDGAVTGVRVDARVVPADAVVLALGPWTDRAREWGVPLPAIRARGGASITLAADVPAQAVFGDWLDRAGRRWSPEIYPRPDGVVYVNGYPEDVPLPDDPDEVQPTEDGWRTLHHIAGAHSSMLADAEVLTRRACYRPVTIDGVPLIGPVVGTRGMFVATGHGPWGILLAPATGRMVAEMILDGRSRSLDARAFDPMRLPPR